MSSASQHYSIRFEIQNALNAAQQIRQVGDAMTQTDAKFKTGKSGVDQNAINQSVGIIIRLSQCM